MRSLTEVSRRFISQDESLLYLIQPSSCVRRGVLIACTETLSEGNGPVDLESPENIRDYGGFVVLFVWFPAQPNAGSSGDIKVFTGLDVHADNPAGSR